MGGGLFSPLRRTSYKALCVHKRSKCASSIFSQRFRFSRAPPSHSFPPLATNDFQGFCERRRRERRKLAILSEILRQFTLILGSIPNSLSVHLEKLAQFIILRSSHSGRIHDEHSMAYPPPSPAYALRDLCVGICSFVRKSWDSPSACFRMDLRCFMPSGRATRRKRNAKRCREFNLLMALDLPACCVCLLLGDAVFIAHGQKLRTWFFVPLFIKVSCNVESVRILNRTQHLPKEGTRSLLRSRGVPTWTRWSIFFFTEICKRKKCCRSVVKPYLGRVLP